MINSHSGEAVTIKTSEEIELLFHANQIVSGVLDLLESKIVEGYSNDDVEFQEAIKAILLQGWDVSSKNNFNRPFNHPEIFGRIQNVLVFNPLPKSIVSEIVILTINKIVTQEKQCILKNVENSIIELLSDKFQNNQSGARPVVEFIEKGLLRAFDKSGIESNSESPVTVVVLNAGTDDRIKFKIQLATVAQE